MSRIRGFASTSKIILSSQLIIQSAQQPMLIVAILAHGLLKD
jgi:hypothetical protein